MIVETPPQDIGRTLQRLFAEMTRPALRLRAFIMLGLLMETVGSVMTVAYPLALKDLVDFLAGEGGHHFPMLVTIALAVACWAGPNLTGACRHFCTVRICSAMATELTRRSMARQLPLLATAGKGDTGAMLGALERMSFSLQLIIDGLMWQVLPLIAQLAVSLAILASAAPADYAGLTTGVLMLVSACAYFNAKRWKKLSTNMNVASGRLSHVQTDVARNARRVISNGNLLGELRGIEEACTARRQAAEAGARSLVRFSLAQNLLLGCGVLLIFILAAHDIQSGAMTVGMFVLIQTYLLRLTQPVASFIFLILGTGVAIENLRVVMEMADGPVPGKMDEGRASKGAAHIRLEDVRYSYGPGLPGVAGVDLDIKPNSFVAIVGPSGAGKSTLAQLIAGLKPVGGGRVLVGGADLSLLDPEHRWMRVLYVPQFISLFDRPLRDNLLYHPATHDEAAALALLAEWGFASGEGAPDPDATVGEMGERLSGGQVQKLEFARVFGVRVPAIIFDESSSSLDPVSEQLVLDRMQRDLQAHTTILFVTHRQAVAERADSVIVMRAGKAIAIGPHAELMASDAYRSLWSRADNELESEDISGPNA